MMEVKNVKLLTQFGRRTSPTAQRTATDEDHLSDSGDPQIQIFKDFFIVLYLSVGNKIA